jgi:hypothetical protein
MKNKYKFESYLDIEHKKLKKNQMLFNLAMFFSFLLFVALSGIILYFVI